MWNYLKKKCQKDMQEFYSGNNANTFTIDSLGNVTASNNITTTGNIYVNNGL